MSGIIGSAGSKSGIIGITIEPSQPAFLAQPASTQTNIPNDSNLQVVWGTVIFDQASNFSGNAFTAPITGKYQFNVTIELFDLRDNASYYQVAMTRSDGEYWYAFEDPYHGGDSQNVTVGLSTLADMDVNDNMSVTVRTSDGTGDVADIKVESYFSGYLVC